jgi:hypothetical protein
MRDPELEEIFVEMVGLIASEKEVRSPQILTAHRMDHRVTERLGVPQKSNVVLHL